MLTFILLALGGAAAITAIALTRGGSASASPLVVAAPVGAPMEFEPEVVTHSPEYLARQAAGMRIFFVGDSLTTSNYWRQMTIPGATLDGQGYKGQQIAVVVKQAAAPIKAFAPMAVVFLAGANDVVADHPPERIERDYAAAWKMIRDSAPGARVYHVLLTPWAGHKKSSAVRQAVTREVNGWARSQRGQPGGPDEVIDPAELGDADGRLLNSLSGDGLHMKTAGYKALAGVIERVLRAGVVAAIGVDVRRILVLGDSLTASGYYKLLKLPDATVTGQGWPNHRVAQLMAKAAGLIAQTAPTEAVLLASVNDIAGGRSVAAICADLDAAWATLHAAGAKVWAVLPTPWFGYTGGAGRESFFADPTLAKRLRATTDAVREYIRSRVGQEGGPDAVIDTAGLGDAQGRLLAKYSHDGLHMNGKGYAALAAVVEGALRGGAMVQQAVAGVLTVEMFDAIMVGLDYDAYDAERSGALPAFDVWSVIDAGGEVINIDVGAEAFNEPHEPGIDIGPDAPKWPTKWRKPTKEILAAVKAASVKHEVPEEVILAVIRKESNFDPKLRGYRPLKASYARNKDHKIPGSSITWGDKFSEDDWRAISIMQVLPFNLFGVPGLLKASDPISAAFNVRTNIMAGARVLKILYDKYGNFEDAVWKYNGSRQYQREVFAFLETFRAAQAVA
jgi:lysophospholipase L1-like esterase